MRSAPTRRKVQLQDAELLGRLAQFTRSSPSWCLIALRPDEHRATSSARPPHRASAGVVFAAWRSRRHRRQGNWAPNCWRDGVAPGTESLSSLRRRDHAAGVRFRLVGARGEASRPCKLGVRVLPHGGKRRLVERTEPLAPSPGLAVIAIASTAQHLVPDPRVAFPGRRTSTGQARVIGPGSVPLERGWRRQAVAQAVIRRAPSADRGNAGAFK